MHEVTVAQPQAVRMVVDEHDVHPGLAQQGVQIGVNLDGRPLSASLHQWLTDGMQHQ
jgi:hypothetical protein